MGKKVSFQITSLIKGSSTCGAFVWRFLFRFEASKGLILHKLPGLTYYCTFSYRNAQLEMSGLDPSKSSPGRTADRLLVLSCPKRGISEFSIRAISRSWAAGRAAAAPSSRSGALAARPAAAAVPAGGQSAPLRAAGLPAAGLPAAAAGAGLEPSTKTASKQRRGQNQPPGLAPRRQPRPRRL